MTRVMWFIAVLLSGPIAAAAQERSAPVVEFAAGALQFPDNAVVTEAFAGGAARFYVSPRLSVGPEIASIHGERHRHLMVTGNVTFDLLQPVTGSRFTPFLVAGAGLYKTNESFPSDPDFSFSEGAFTVGGGVRASVGRRVVVGVEARIGWELHLRVNGFAGVRLGQ